MHIHISYTCFLFRLDLDISRSSISRRCSEITKNCLHLKQKEEVPGTRKINRCLNMTLYKRRPRTNSHKERKNSICMAVCSELPPKLGSDRRCPDPERGATGNRDGSDKRLPVTHNACSLDVCYFVRPRNRDDKQLSHTVTTAMGGLVLVQSLLPSQTPQWPPTASPLQAFIFGRQEDFTQCVQARDLSFVMPASFAYRHFAYSWHLSHMQITLARVLRGRAVAELMRQSSTCSPSAEMHWFMQWSLEQPTNWAMQDAQLPE